MMLNDKENLFFKPLLPRCDAPQPPVKTVRTKNLLFLSVFSGVNAEFGGFF